MHSFRYSPARGRFRDWLGTITRRKVNRHLKKKNLGTTGAGGDGQDGANVDPRAIESDAEWSAEFNAQILRAALDRVRPCFGTGTWNAFASVWLENQSAAEAARTLGVSLEAVYVAKSKVLKRLEQEVLELAEDFPLANTNADTNR
jgi:RNA polymerase sigma-70 factor, ECF subfamily